MYNTTIQLCLNIVNIFLADSLNHSGSVNYFCFNEAHWKHKYNYIYYYLLMKYFFDITNTNTALSRLIVIKI